MIDREYARNELRLKETDELVDILVARDEDEWSPEVFPIVEEVLRERDVRVAEAVAARRHASAAVLDDAIVRPPARQPVVLAEFDDDREAELCRMALAQTGIEAELRDPAPGVWELRVDASDQEAAQAALDAIEASDSEGDEGGFRCPSCGFIADPIQEGARRVCQVCGEAV